MIIIRLTRNIDNVASVFAEKKKKTCRKTDLTKSEISRSSLARESILYEYKTENWTNSLFARLLEFRNGNIPEYLACINDFSNWIKVSKPMIKMQIVYQFFLFLNIFDMRVNVMLYTARRKILFYCR